MYYTYNFTSLPPQMNWIEFKNGVCYVDKERLSKLSLSSIELEKAENKLKIKGKNDRSIRARRADETLAWIAFELNRRWIERIQAQNSVKSELDDELFDLEMSLDEAEALLDDDEI